LNQLQFTNQLHMDSHMSRIHMQLIRELQLIRSRTLFHIQTMGWLWLVGSIKL